MNNFHNDEGRCELGILHSKQALEAKMRKADYGPTIDCAINVIFGAEETLGAFGVYVFKIDSGQLDFTMSCDEIILVLEGSMKLTDQDTAEICRAVKGDVVLIPKGMKCKLVSEKGVKYLSIAHPPFAAPKYSV